MFHQTNTLTTGIDAVTGTAGDDTISGARVDGVQTWNSGDKIDGGAGNDTLTAVINGTVAPAAGGVTNVENLVVTATGSASEIIFANAAGTTVGIAGVTSVTNLASTQVLKLTDLTAIPVITLNNASAGTVVTFATDVLAGTADTVTLNLSGVNPAAAVGGGINLAAGAAGIENLVINSTTAASSINALHFDANTGTDGLGLGGANSSVKTVTVTGDADLTLAGSAFAKVTSFDSTATGGITASFATFGSGKTNVQTITTGAGKDTITLGQDGAEYTSITVNTGAGDDKVVVGDRLSSKHSIDGGAGKDTLSIDTGGETITVDNVALVNNQTSNFEVMEFANRVDVLNASSFTGFTDYVFTQASTANGATVITGLTSANSLTFKADLTGTAGNVGGATSAASSSAVKFTATGTAQTLNITADATSAPLALVGGIGGAGEAKSAGTDAGAAANSAVNFGGGITTLNIVADTNMTITGGAGGKGGAGDGTDPGGVGGAAAAAVDNGTAVKTVTISGDGDVTILGGAKGATGADSGGDGGAVSENGFTGAVTVDASALKGKLDIQGSAGEDTITGGKGADIIRAGGSNDTIDITAGGSNTIVFEATAGDNGIDTITGFKVGLKANDGDVLNLSLNDISSSSAAAPTANTNLLAVDQGSAGGTFAADAITVLKFNGTIASKDFGSATGFAELFGAGKTFAATMTASKEAVLVVQGTDATHVYHVVNDGTAGLLAGEVSLIAVLDGVSSSNTLVAENFLI